MSNEKEDAEQHHREYLFPYMKAIRNERKCRK